MTSEQKQLVIDNHNLIYYILKLHGIDDFDDWYDIAAIGLCNAALSFDDSKGKFASYACACMEHQLCKEFNKMNRHKRIPTSVLQSLEAEVSDTDGLNLGDMLEGGDPNPEDEIIAKLIYSKLLHILTPTQLEYLEYCMLGYNQFDISKKMGVSRTRVYAIRQQINNKYIKEFGEI